MPMKEKYFAQPSVMKAQQHFSQVPRADIPRSKFDRSHGLKTTFDADRLIPVFVDEVLPGDTFTMKSTAFCRLATPLKPIMDNVYLDTHYFFVPYRLVWTNWERFCGERATPSDVITGLTIPQTVMDLNAADGQDLVNYMGIPRVPGISSFSISALPIRAYFLIWNEWYRDQNLQDIVSVPLGDGPDVWGMPEPARRGKRHDYFTSALPWPQKGDPVVVPIGSRAPVKGIAVEGTAVAVPSASNQYQESDGTFWPNLQEGWGAFEATATYNFAVREGATNNRPDIYADLTNATAISINSLRSAFQIQKLLERDARGGTRYNELILSHFGVLSDDARLQRPEYLGGGTTRVNINPIAATATDASVPQGNLAAVGTAINAAGFQKSFTEHGIIIGLVSARADLTYQQGAERFWNRRTRYDFYWPALAHLGEQAVLNKEIVIAGAASDDLVFGYQERYAEYRYKPSRITGLFNSQVAAPLDVWHLSEEFGIVPALNSNFISSSTPIDRVIAVPSEPHFLCDMWFDLKCDRPMPVYSVPGLIDHF